MAEFIENRPVSCRTCGYGPIYGSENSTTQGDRVYCECRWVCSRCGSLVRIDEKVININNPNEETH